MTYRRPPRRVALLLAVAGLALLGAGCGGGDDSTSGSSLPPGHVDVKDNFFTPGTVRIKVGDTVTWTFRGAVSHNVTGPGFTSKTMKAGIFTHSFEKAGTLNYVCTIHTGMKGKIVVK